MLDDWRIPRAITVMTVLALERDIVQPELFQKADCGLMLFLYLVQTP
jgi:hypothetical protein